MHGEVECRRKTRGADLCQYWYSWDWTPIERTCAHCEHELLVVVGEHAAIRHICINPECGCYEAPGA